VPRKILLADDSVTAQNMGKKILSDAGYEVITVSNGSAALKKVTELMPDIVVLDVYMPGYSGLEVCKLLRENKLTTEIPILLTVGKLEPFKSEEALKARANAFIVKPFEATELLAVIRKIEDANAKPAAKPGKAGKLNSPPRTFAGSTADSPEAQEAGIEEKGWKNRLAMPSKKKQEPEPEPEEAPAAMGTGFRDLTAPAEDESTLRRESAFTADLSESQAPESKVPEKESPKSSPLNISPEEIAAIKAAVEVLSGEGDRAPVLHVSAEGTPRHLAPEPEEPEETTAPQISAPTPVQTPSTPRWVAEASDLTQAESAISLEREMQEAHGNLSAPAEAFNTYSLASFAESEVPEPVDDEPIYSEVAAQETAAAEAAEQAAAETKAHEVTAHELVVRELAVHELAITDAVATTEVEAPANALAASASGDSHISMASPSALPNGIHSQPEANGFQDLTPVASAAATATAPETTHPENSSAGIASPIPLDPTAPEDEIDSRTKSQMGAAWTNWREIRNTIVTPNLTDQLAEVATAVVKEDAAHGGEAAHDPDSIASIVDSVLAEMRPKLLEEIARKLAAKKQ
jgi:CheY-like chemotaxis protein